MVFEIVLITTQQTIEVKLLRYRTDVCRSQQNEWGQKGSNPVKPINYLM